MASGRLIDYLGYGPIIDRPVTPDLYANTLGIWFDTDDELFSAWTGAAWVDLVVSVSSVNGQVGVVTLTVGDLDDVIQPTGGWQSGDILYYSSINSSWVPLPAGSPGEFLSVETGGAPLWVPLSFGIGDVVGPVSSVDNTLPRFDGTTGDLLQGSGIVVSDSDEISAYRANINSQTGTTYTLVSADTGKVIDHSNGAAITVTLPNNMPQGFCVTYIQSGAGLVTFSPASGAVLRNRQSHVAAAGQFAMCTLVVRANPGGSSADYVLGGDTA